MASKEINFSDNARNRLFEGVKQLSDAVKVTMGPRGRNVLIQKFWCTKYYQRWCSCRKRDRISRSYRKHGAQLVKEVASKTADAAGDGTTTATVLAYSIFKEGLRNITAGANPIEVKRGMDKAAEAITEELKKITKPVAGKKKLPKLRQFLQILMQK